MLRRVGRYEIGPELARGGMATVHLGRLLADGGFSRLVAIKMVRTDRLGSSFETRALEDEARLVSRIRHPNVVATLDVITDGRVPILIMDYVEGESLARLIDSTRERNAPAPSGIAARILMDILKGLHAAHEARDYEGTPLGIVHRDVSPQNVLVGVDGLSRLADFGIARAARRSSRTLTGAVKGKPSYMSPEQLRGLPLTRQADVYAAGKVLVDLGADAAFASVVDIATRPDARARFATAAEMAAAIESAVACASYDEVARWVRDLASDALELRAELERTVENTPRSAAASSSNEADALHVVAPFGASQRKAWISATIVAVCVLLAVVALRWTTSSPSSVTAGQELNATSTAVTSMPAHIPSPVEGTTPATSGPDPAAAPPEQHDTTAPSSTTRIRAGGASKPAPRRGDDHCQPPFTLDEHGVKHYRVECL